MTILPDHILRKMSSTDREAIGQKTAEEAAAAFSACSERKQQKIFSSWLFNMEHLGRLTWNMPASHVKSTIRSGWPDFVVHHLGRTIYIEMKSPGASLSEEQKIFAHRLKQQRIPHFICYNASEAIKTVNAELFG